MSLSILMEYCLSLNKSCTYVTLVAPSSERAGARSRRAPFRTKLSFSVKLMDVNTLSIISVSFILTYVSCIFLSAFIRHSILYYFIHKIAAQCYA